MSVTEQPDIYGWSGFILVIPSEVQEAVTESTEKVGKCQPAAMSRWPKSLKIITSPPQPILPLCSSACLCIFFFFFFNVLISFVVQHGEVGRVEYSWFSDEERLVG